MKLNNRQRAKLTLDELEKEMEILTKEEMNACKGGGSGTQTDPYTQDEFYMLDSSGVFTGGYVQGWGYVQPIEGIAVFHEDKNKSIYNKYDTFSGFISTSNSITDHLARFGLGLIPVFGDLTDFMENNLNAMQRDMIGDIVGKGYSLNSSLYISATRDGSDGIVHTVYDGVTGEVITRKKTNSVGYYDNSSEGGY